jgi:hypothetical protein
MYGNMNLKKTLNFVCAIFTARELIKNCVELFGFMATANEPLEADR